MARISAAGPEWRYSFDILPVGVVIIERDEVAFSDLSVGLH